MFIQKRFLLAFVLLCAVASAQIPPPKRESRLHHIFGDHRDTDNLGQRYRDLRCALVVIQSGDRLGTGFYVNASGDAVTASHVLGNRLFEPDGERLRITLQLPAEITIRTMTEQFVVAAAANVENNADQWSADVALLRTGRAPPCWMDVGDDARVRPGQHVVALGFPALAFGSLSIYNGIVSARFTSGLIIGTTVQGLPLRSTNELLRVQMPVSPGLSGAPVVDDENRAIGVVTSAGAWSQDLDVLAQLSRTGAIHHAPAPNTVDLPFAIAQLAMIFHDYTSPGYGDAAPLHYLGRRAAAPVHQPASPAH
jgi:S1-C subfamily serine protease